MNANELAQAHETHTPIPIDDLHPVAGIVRVESVYGVSLDFEVELRGVEYYVTDYGVTI